MKDYNVKLYKNGVYKDTCYHVSEVVFDDDWKQIRIYSLGFLVTTLKHPEKWRLSISFHGEK